MTIFDIIKGLLSAIIGTCILYFLMIALAQIDILLNF
jgi:hypothetical protein